MTYETTGYKQHSSRFGGIFYYLFLKRDDGQQFRTCIDPKLRNYPKWSAIIEGVKNNTHFKLGDLNEIHGKAMIDADSTPRVLAQFQSTLF